MLYFWELGKCTVSEIINTMEEPRPPHSSISTIVRILEKKDFWITRLMEGRMNISHRSVKKNIAINLLTRW